MNQSNIAEAVNAKNQYFSDMFNIKKAMVEAYCLTFVKLVRLYISCMQGLLDQYLDGYLFGTVRS